MTAKRSLARYHRRRDFSKTAEPEGQLDELPDELPSYVVQIHDARSMHFDFRLEADGVLKSFAVPKGPSNDPHDKRFATPTEDHPLAYRDFEGTIPEGQYGGGTVIVWDQGTYRNATTGRDGREIPLSEALEQGHASFRLDGRKLHGGYSLTRIRDTREGGKEAWLLVKQADERASSTGTPDPRRARSVRTGRTLNQVAADARPGRGDHP
ncbi:3'-phosphoesterase [Streptomyces sp. ISL-44]|uniref:DNA polymerase ligase N-terminal domain-containing protein n=1 Tax=Streptomyces sp. ISL-44 TaxID=2819184 RepID=UPI001BE5F552|nr:DNA polymerase ligase N-terminal domain-containing protein [Streptomyces sp. ISL-44]MBT2541583.1 3'-phosphoesterase [Streptomyces sp. ISL-44]